MITWASIVLTALKIINAIVGAVNQLRWKQAGRDEVTSKVNAETLETKNAMDSVPRPSDDAVADSLRTGKF